MVYNDVTEKDMKKLEKYNFIFLKPKAKTEKCRMKDSSGTILVLYNTGKLIIQGKKSKEIENLLDFLGFDKTKGRGPAIGTDEALKGDTFGGIVVAGFLADEEIRKSLKEMNVKDSKTMLNPDIVKLATEIIEKFPNNYHIENIYPKEYNKMNIRHNVTEILNILHEKCYKTLAKKDKNKRDVIHIVDLYPGCNVGDIKEEKADSKYIEVSAASVLARYGALVQIRELERKAGFFIPMGSSNVESGLLELKKKSLNPNDFVKMNFKNVVEFWK